MFAANRKRMLNVIFFMKTPKDDSYYNIRENAGTILTDIKMISFLKQANKEQNA